MDALDLDFFNLNQTNGNGTDDLTSILQDLQGSLTGNPNISSFWSAILTISYTLVICIGIAENLIVLCAIFCHKQLLSTTHNLLIATLAFSDLLLCGITLPTNMWELLNRQWPFGANSKILCQFLKAAEKFPLFLSATAIIAIAWDRYRGIVASNPRHMKLASTLKGIFSMVAISILATSPIFYFTRIRSLMKIETNIPEINLCYEEWPFWFQQTYKIAANIAYILLPALVVLYMNFSVVHRLKKRPPAQNAIENQRRQRVMRTLLAMALIYSASWMPYLLFSFMAELLPEQMKYQFEAAQEIMYGFLKLLGATNALVNPILYGYLNGNFRTVYKDYYQKLPWYSTTQVEGGVIKMNALKTTEKRISFIEEENEEEISRLDVVQNKHRYKDVF